MSGIAGLWRLDGRPTEFDLDRMLVRLAHRGLDGAGAWRDASVALGQRMLHTTPESRHERQPLTNSEGDLVLTADARLDNREELCSLLCAPCSAPDAELILRAYERWGERCPERLLGDFAFAIWDARRQIVFCARDHFGVKPFYYHHRPGHLFAFASEIKGLLALPDVPRRLNETRVADYLVPLLEDKEITFYEEIVRLPPAHRMTVTRAGVRIEQYWALDPEREIRMKSDAEYADGFREIFTEAVRCRLRSAFPVGSMLSGGLDSSSIVCVARDLLAADGSRPLHTFSVVFPDLPECDEREYIDAVISSNGVAPHFVRGDRLSPLDDLDRALAVQDEPFYAPNLFLHWGLYGAARAADMRVILDGLDGDTTISHGIGYLRELVGAGRWVRAVREARGLSRQLGVATRRILLAKVLKPALSQWLRRPPRAAHASRTKAGADDIIAPNFARHVRLADRMRALGSADRLPARTERQDHHRTLRLGLLPLVLEVADHAARAWRLEPRYPYFDKRLVEFCLALPGEQKLHDGWTRMVLRRAMQGVLPPEIQWRVGKADLSAGFLRGMVDGVARPAIEALFVTSAPIGAYVDLARLRAVHQAAASPGGERGALTIWKALTLNRWLETRCLGPTHQKEVAHAQTVAGAARQARTPAQAAV